MKFESLVTLATLTQLGLCAPNARIVKRAGFTSPDLSSPSHEQCSTEQLSCSSGAKDGCCMEATNGILMSTQFWDYNPATGPADKFTLHGLWPDTCDGGYNQYCNPSWEISDAEAVLQGETDLLNTMNEIWKNSGAPDSELWEHEFNKHGTCMETLNPDCYSGGAANQTAIDFFKTSVAVWQELPTYEWLTAAGYEPSDSKTYNVADFQKVLAGQLGVQKVQLECDDSNALNQVMYYFKLKGSIATGTFQPIDALDAGSSCKDGFSWKPKSS